MLKKIVCGAALLMCTLQLTAAKKSPKNVLADEKSEASDDTLLVHTITFLNKGSRSERRVGVLHCGEVVLPYAFIRVQSMRSSYRFVTSRKLWGDHGYQQASMSALEESAEEISLDEIEQGVYMSRLRKAGTPDDWLYLEWKKGAAFVKPQALKKIFKSDDFRALPNLMAPASSGKIED